MVKTNFSDDANNLYHNDPMESSPTLQARRDLELCSIPTTWFWREILDYDNE